MKGKDDWKECQEKKHKKRQNWLVEMQSIKQWCCAWAIRTPFKTQMQPDRKQLSENLQMEKEEKSVGGTYKTIKIRGFQQKIIKRMLKKKLGRRKKGKPLHA